MLSTFTIQGIIGLDLVDFQDGMYICQVCNHKAATKQKIQNHIEAKHSESPGYYCQICDKHCTTKNALFIHNSRYHRT